MENKIIRNYCKLCLVPKEEKLENFRKHFNEKAKAILQGFEYSDRYCIFPEYQFLNEWTASHYNWDLNYFLPLAPCSFQLEIYLKKENAKNQTVKKMEELMEHAKRLENFYDEEKNEKRDYLKQHQCDCELGRMPIEKRLVNATLVRINNTKNKEGWSFPYHPFVSVIEDLYIYGKPTNCFIKSKHMQYVADVVIVDRYTGEIKEVREIENTSEDSEGKQKFYYKYFKNKYKVIKTKYA